MLINLTQHVATADQGATEPANKAVVQDLLTFEEIPTTALMVKRAKELADIAAEAGATEAMIGGAPFFMSVLEAALVMKKIEPVYAFSKRETVEEKQQDGSVRKVAVFRHLGFVPAATQYFDQQCKADGYPCGTGLGVYELTRYRS